MQLSIDKSKCCSLAPSQIPEWYAYQLDPSSSVYNISFNHFFFEKINVQVFIATWQKILDRHDIFRIRFTYHDGKPWQYLGDKITLTESNVIIDRRNLTDADVLTEQNSLAKYYALKSFDFENGPLFHLYLVAYPLEQYQLIFTIHHIIWDETSTMNLVNEFREIYLAYYSKQDVNLPALPITYFDYAKQINQNILNGSYDVHKKYWLDMFKTIPAPLNLPTDFSRPAIQTYDGNTLIQWLPKELIRQVQGYLGKNNCTLFIFYLAVLELYIYRITGQDDFVLGCPIAGRNNAEYKNLLGCFAVPMPLRSQINQHMTFKDLLANVKDRVIAAFEHYHYPCVELIENLQTDKDLSRPKLFSVMAGIQNNKSTLMDIRLGEGRLYAKDIYSAENHGARFDLAVGLDPIGSDVKLFCTYNTSLFTQSTITRLFACLSHLFSQVITYPEKNLTAYQLVTPIEQKTLSDFNDTKHLYSSASNIIALFEEQVTYAPHQIALIDQEQQISYLLLNQQANQLAHYLIQNQVEQGQAVGVLLEPGFDMFIILIAILKIGACYVPMLPDAPARRIEEIIDICQLKIIIHKSHIVTSEKLCWIAIDKAKLESQQFETDNLSLQFPKQTLAYILFTSGTTGKPKGIPITHHGLSNLIAATQSYYKLSPVDKILFITSYNFDASILEIFWPLTSGASIIINKGDYLAKDPNNIINMLCKYNITVLQTVPTLLQAICRAKESLAMGEMSQLRLIICGAEAMSRSLRDKAYLAFPTCQLVNHYGPTEVTVDATRFDCSQEFFGDNVPLGKPFANCQVFILDGFLQSTPIGVTGEIYIASPGLTPGYINDDIRNKQAFVTFKNGKRLYKTGDRGKYDEQGNIYFVGRTDNQVKINGNRVELEEITQILKHHPLIANAAVKLHNDNKLIAFIELTNDTINKMMASDQSEYYQFTLAQQPHLVSEINKIHLDTWPRYFEGSPYLKKYWPQLYSTFPEYQFCLVTQHNQIAAVGNGIPLYWDGTKKSVPNGWDDAIKLAFTQHASGIMPNTVLGLAGIITKNYQGKGLSKNIVQGFRKLAKMHSLNNFLGPVRPVGMLEHNIYDVSKWAQLRDHNNLPMDYWLRVHERLGAEILTIAPDSQLVEGTLEQWYAWTGEKWSESGHYSIPETLQMIKVDVNNNWATYYDPSIWVGHYNLQNEQGVSSHFNNTIVLNYLIDKLPAYMLPERIVLVAKMPLTSGAKPDLQALPNFATFLTTPIAAKNELQVELINCWKKILEKESIGIEDDFFLLGGRSLSVIQMLSTIKIQYHVTISLKDFYRQPTIKQLELLIHNAIEE